ncbi:hypothetical protein BVRB_7g170940 [Beta vulgaris subsp. vulgaris]|nr:hypothetical protein BVRB_7g170940 [Beta vulgaris subsp. vulgaris]
MLPFSHKLFELLYQTLGVHDYFSFSSIHSFVRGQLDDHQS